MKTRHKIICAVYLITIKNDKLLLMLRQNTGWKDGQYSLSAGHLEPDETLAQAMVREVKEEIGINLTKDDLHLVHIQHRRKSPDGDEDRIDFFYSADKWSGEVINMEPEKCIEVSWHNLNALPQNMIDHQRAAVLAYLKNNANYSEYGWDKLDSVYQQK